MAPDAAPARDTILSFLGSNSFLGALPEQALSTLYKAGHTKSYGKGQVIYERGELGDHLIVILTGFVKISNVTADGREVVHNLLSPGDLHGEIALLDGGVRTATATALEGTSAFVLYRRDLLPVLKAYPDSLLEMVVNLCEKLRNTSQSLEDAQLSMQGRMIGALLRLSRQHGRRTKDGVLIDLELTQRDLGSFAGLSRENTSRLLASLSRADILSVSSGSILIKNESRLKQLAESETC
jgi:CRP-like cAMP-binding protein